MRKISALVIFFLLFVFNPGYCISPSETIWIAPGNKPSITLYGRGLPKVAVNIYRLNYLPGRKEDILLLKLGKPVNTVVKQFKNIDANTERTILLPPVKEGIYFVTAVSGKYKNSVIVVVTKLCLVAKVEKGQSLILAFDVVKSKPAEGVDINVYSSNKVAVHGKTDKSGLFKVSLPSGDYDLRIVGRKNDSYAEIYDRIVESDNFYKVYAYTDRPIYRPNHTINYKAVIRKINEGEREYSNSPAIPVKVIVTDSFGSEIFLQDKVADEHGSISGNFTLGNEPALGTYTISFEAGGKLHYCNFQVEEYKKPEFEMEVNPLNRFFIEGQKIQAQIDAKYYLGDSLKAAAYEYSVYQKEFQLPDYDSEDKKDTYWDEPGLVSAGSSSSFAQGTFVEKGSGKLDEKGQALIEIPTDKLGYDRTYDVKVKVTDISNKTIEKSFPVLVTRAPYFLTVSSDNYVYELKQTINAKIRARKFDGQPVQLNGTAYLGHEVWNKKEQKYMFVSYDYKPFTADTDGNAKVKFTASTPGYLTIRVISSEQSPVKVLADASIEIFDSKNIKKVNMKKEKYPVLSLKQDSKFYRVGETAKILLVSKYRRGYVLLTIEGEKIHEYRMFQLNSNITMLKIPVKKEYYPTLHFKVVLLNGVNRESSALELPIRNEEKFLKVKISTYKDVYAPGEKCNVQIETADFKDQAVPSEVSLAIVDESIYAIASDMSQPIRRFFWGYRENEVATLYSESIYYNAGAYQNVGEKVKIRRKFLDTAYWNPYIITDKNGKAALEFDYPDNLTTWRLTAIGITDDTKVGRNVLKKIVRKDFYLRLDTPVFLVKGDKSTIRCHIHNSTAKDIDVNLKLTGDTFPLNIERTVKVKAGGVESLEFLSV
ncbi:MAG: MG2 domain-containing protein, partial [Firmicutes bacterium]|nr:MG2 domain-containing protein [Bacillota bacterium]